MTSETAPPAGERLFMDVRASPDDLGKAVMPLGRRTLQHMLGLLLQFWVVVKAREMGWRHLAAVAMGQGEVQGVQEGAPGCAHLQGAGAALPKQGPFFQGIMTSFVNHLFVHPTPRHQVLAQYSVYLTVISVEP